MKKHIKEKRNTEDNIVSGLIGNPNFPAKIRRKVVMEKLNPNQIVIFSQISSLIFPKTTKNKKYPGRNSVMIIAR